MRNNHATQFRHAVSARMTNTTTLADLVTCVWLLFLLQPTKQHQTSRKLGLALTEKICQVYHGHNTK